ncbi:circularly permuted type 2 ATP-grasp protein [Runella sp.]|uniref:circularly permuted type 2 ATP-grasp protein n=1 Tax=Runella sp. TaxID=1960881 RepID=UPI003D1061D4
MHTSTSIDLLQSYQQEINSYDETIGPDGHVKPHWKTLFTSLERLGIKELEARNQEIINRLRENGVTYNIYDSSDGLNRPWQLDPIPFLIEQKEWDHISKGLKQRALVLDLMLKDIYGPQKLVKDDILPPELVFDNTGFFRPCFDIKLPSQNQLILYAADMARGPDGRMWLVDNRTQVPSGAGYTLENRRIMSKLLPELTEGMFVNRLSPFFNHFSQTVSGFANRGKENPNIIYLTPGSNNETYFEHAYLASYLGYTLAQGDDLLVRNGYVWLKSIDGLERVDVIVRRVDDDWCDPLELREDSRLGVPGLLHVIRSGNVVVLNPPGASVLENSALLAFMNITCRYFLGEELIMPSIATWWCGQPKERNFVLANLHRLIIKKANRKQRFRSMYGRLLTNDQLADLRNAILQHPHEYIAQEEVSLSTTPSLVDGKIEPRLASLRAFLVSDGNEYQVMNGGLTRSSAEKDRYIISNQYGGISKDTWIVSDTMPEVNTKIAVQKTAPVIHHTSLPSRTAENLFWVGRYSERTMALTKFMTIVINALNENVAFRGSYKSEYIDILLQSVTHLTFTYPGFTDEGNTAIRENPYLELIELIHNAQKPGSVASHLSSFLHCVISVSDKWNNDTRRIINLIENSQKKVRNADKHNPNSFQKVLDKLHIRLFSFYGIISESMPRDSGYFLLEAGKLVERVLSRISIIRSFFSFKNDENIENELIEALLTNQHLLVHYRQIYKTSFNLEAALDMVLLDKKLPYSLVYQLDLLSECLCQLPKDARFDRLNQAEKAVLEASVKIKLAAVSKLSACQPNTQFRENLDRLLGEVTELISSVTFSLTQLYFMHTVIQNVLLEGTNNNETNEV